MNILAILISLVADRFLAHLHHLRRYDVLVAFAGKVRGFMDGTPGLVVVIAVPVLVAGFIQAQLADGLLSLLGLLFAVAVLLFCLGPRDLAQDVESYCDAREAGERVAAENAARQISGVAAGEGDQLDRAVINGLLVRANPSMFAVVFWFVLLGPVGAVMYRAASALAVHFADEDRSEFRDASARLLGILDWIPARLVALSYALSGHFDGAFAAWRNGVHHEFGLEGSSIELLMEVGNGALGTSSAANADTGQVKEAMNLVWRSLTVWLVLLAVLTLAGLAD